MGNYYEEMLNKFLCAILYRPMYLRHVYTGISFFLINILILSMIEQADQNP